MMHARMYAFVVGMWGLVIAGGGIAVLVLGSIRIDDGADEVAPVLLSGAKALAAVLLVVAWVYILEVVKRRVFGVRART